MVALYNGKHTESMILKEKSGIEEEGEPQFYISPRKEKEGWK